MKTVFILSQEEDCCGPVESQTLGVYSSQALAMNALRATACRKFEDVEYDEFQTVVNKTKLFLFRREFHNREALMVIEHEII